MTISEAYRLLEAKYPTASFCIGLDVWRHRHYDGTPQNPRIEWTINVVNLARSIGRWAGSSLDVAMAQVLEGPGSLAEVESAGAGMP